MRARMTQVLRRYRNNSLVSILGEPDLPLFIVKKQVFKWIENRQKHIEIRKGRPMQGDEAVFQCGKQVIRRKIVLKKEGARARELDNF